MKRSKSERKLKWYRLKMGIRLVINQYGQKLERKHSETEERTGMVAKRLRKRCKNERVTLLNYLNRFKYKFYFILMYWERQSSIDFI